MSLILLLLVFDLSFNLKKKKLYKFQSQSTLVCLVISLCIALTSAQFFGGFGRSHNSLTQLTGDFGGPTAFSGLPTANGGRDPRQNRGKFLSFLMTMILKNCSNCFNYS